MKKILFGLGLIILGVFVQAQNGLENIIVEKYYIANAADAAGSSGTLPAGSVTYRIYADMLPGYKFQMAYGTANHNLKFTTTTSFFNNTDYGSTFPDFSKSNAAKNTVMLDSWLSVGGACANNFGILKSDDNGLNNVVNIDALLHNNTPAMGIPLTTQDGLIAGSPLTVSLIGMDPGQSDPGAADVFGDGSVVGNSFVLTGSAWTTLSSGATGPIPATNRVLIAQITTNGTFHYELNVQIGTPTGGYQVYVSSNPVMYNGQMERTMPSLSGTYTPPIAYAVTGSGSYCQGSGGLPVGLANSEIGVTYTLTPGGVTLAGTGSAITFGNQLAGTYTISGTNELGTTNMNGSAIITENTLVIPSFTQLGPYTQGTSAAVLPLTSTNSITGTWAPATISTATIGTQVYTFTPAAGQCANVAHMSVVIQPIITLAWAFMGDIGTTIQVTWPSVTNAANYSFQYRPYGSSAAWIGIGSTTSSVKIGNLTPGQHYDCRVRAYLASGSPTGAFQTSDFTTTATAYSKAMDMGTASQMSWDDYSPWASSYVFQYKKHTASSWTNVPCYLPYCKMTTEPGVAYDCQVIVYHAGLLYGTTSLNTFNANAFTSSIANNTGTSLDLTWTNFDLNNPAPWIVGAGSTQYLRYRVAGSTGAWIQKTVAGGINTYHLTGLTVNTNYEFTVSVYLPAFWGISNVANFNTNSVKSVASDITNHSANVYPNPFTDKVNMNLYTENETTVTWNIYDMTGKVVLSGSESITGGYNTLNIDAASLSKGIYMLNAIMNDQMQSFRIMKK